MKLAKNSWNILKKLRWFSFSIGLIKIEDEHKFFKIVAQKHSFK